MANKYFVYQHNNYVRLKTSEGLIEINRSSTSRSISQLSWLTPPNTTELPLTAISLLLLSRFRHFRVANQRFWTIRICGILLDRLDQLRRAVSVGSVGLCRVEYRGTAFRCRICIFHGGFRAIAHLCRSNTGVHLLLDLRDAAAAGRSGGNHIDFRGVQCAAVFRISLRSIRRFDGVAEEAHSDHGIGFDNVYQSHQRQALRKSAECVHGMQSNRLYSSDRRWNMVAGHGSRGTP